MRVLFAGIGGVGGFFGGMLAHYYKNNLDVSVCFLARGAHLVKIQKEGLLVKHKENSFVTIPHLASDSPAELGAMDYIFLSTKSYDVAQTAKMLQPCIGPKTKIITLLNGVDSVGVIRDIYPHNEVVNGCVYILSKIESPGVVVNFGGVQKLFLGRNHQGIDDLKPLESVLVKAGIDAVLTDAVLETTWSKYVFISGVGTSTSFFDVGLGAILESEDKRAILVSLLEEVKAVGKAMGVALNDDLVDVTLTRLANLPFDTTSSMQRDFQNGNKTELNSQTKFVIDQGVLLGVATPTYEKLFPLLKERERK
ncbi:MAG: 2-dehydropantoate 2-reductase [Salibacteraceae bacterium]|jgi:2-dehydropantoate 2-reductase